MPPALIKVAAGTTGTTEVTVGGALYQVLAQPIRGFDNQVVGNVVMARQLDSVLLSLFPGARFVFTLTMLGAILIAAVSALRTRQITRA